MYSVPSLVAMCNKRDRELSSIPRKHDKIQETKVLTPWLTALQEEENKQGELSYDYCLLPGGSFEAKGIGIS